MAEGDDEERSGSTWHWAFLIPIMALLIPIIAVAEDSLAALTPVLVTVAIIGGGWIVGRNLLGYRHELRMQELAAEQQVRALEAEQLREAAKVLELDDRLVDLQRSVADAPVEEAPKQQQPPATA